MPPPRRLLRRGPREPRSRRSTPASRSPASAGVRWCATRCSAPSACSALPAVVLLRDLGPTTPRSSRTRLPGSGLEHTVWTKGMRVVRDVVGTPIRPSDLEIGDLVNAEPEALFDGRRRRRAADGGRRRCRSPSPRAPSSWSGWSPTRSSPARAGRTGRSTASSATRRSAPTSAARSRSTSGPPTTCSARATSRRSTWPTPARSSSARPAGPCRSCRSRSTTRATLWHRATSRSRWDRASGSGSDSQR